MPEALQHAVANLGAPFTEKALSNWSAIGEPGREAFFNYVNGARTRRGYRKLCKLAAVQLSTPEIGYLNGRGVT